MKNSALTLLLIVAGVAVLAAGSLYFGAPLFGWLIIAAIFVIFIGAAFKDFKLIKQVESESEILKEISTKRNPFTEAPSSGIVAERINGVMEVCNVNNLSVEAFLEVLNARFSLKFGKSASGVVILLGLMGTFFGLMLSVSTAGSAIDNSSTAATMDTVHSIFSSMKGIFGTSLCGIFASLILSAIHTLTKNDVEKFAADLDFFSVSKLYKMCAPLPAESNNDEDVAEKMEQVAETMRGAFATTVAEVKNAFVESQNATIESMRKMSAELSSNFANTASALNAKFEAMATANSAATTKLVSDVSNQFAGTRSATLESVNSLLETFKNGLTAAVDSSVANMQNMQNAFPAELKESVSALSSQINASLVKQSETASAEWSKLMERFAEIADKSAAAEAEHLASLHGASAGLSETLAAEIAKINSNVETSIKALAGELSTSVKAQVEESSAQWNSFMAKLESASAESTKSQREGLETLANVAVQVAEKAQAGSADLSTRVTEEISKLSSDVQSSFKSLAETSAALVEAQKQLLEGVENRVVKENEASETLTSNINEASTLMRVNQSEFSAGLEMFNKGLEALLEKLSGDTEEKSEEEGFVEQIRRSLELFHERASEILMENAVKTQEILLEILEQSQRAALTSEKKDA